MNENLPNKTIEKKEEIKKQKFVKSKGKTHCSVSIFFLLLFG